MRGYGHFQYSVFILPLEKKYNLASVGRSNYSAWCAIFVIFFFVKMFVFENKYIILPCLKPEFLKLKGCRSIIFLERSSIKKTDDVYTCAGFKIVSPL